MSEKRELERIESALKALIRIVEHQERVLVRIEKLLEQTYPATSGITVKAS